VLLNNEALLWYVALVEMFCANWRRIRTKR
jgi:hypothetical protein